MSYNDISRKAPGPQQLRNILFEIRAAEKDGEKEKVSNLWKQVNEVEREFLNPEPKLYCGDVLIEFRPGVLKYESLRRLQGGVRLSAELDEVKKFVPSFGKNGRQASRPWKNPVKTISMFGNYRRGV